MPVNIKYITLAFNLQGPTKHEAKVWLDDMTLNLYVD